ncbi:sigma factor-like helix-turn-helix DNA-binding protein [Streptomyces sp. NPDC020858]|uniref:sigma factor-like helix-turn-helix DNA-binding protein n=1 Tax=Streptomyces sp. NPDC020858 TaxID=3365097 RepID=UPI00379E5988
MNGDGAYLAARFEERRGQLRAVAERMLGSLPEAQDAIEEAGSRLGCRADGGAASAYDMGGWLTTVVARVCVERLRARNAPGGSAEPSPGRSHGPAAAEQEGLLLADSVGLALFAVLEQLAPAERLSFVLHDLFGLPFDEIAPIVERTPAGARQLASRARRRVRGGAPEPEWGSGSGSDPGSELSPFAEKGRRQREIVGAFLAAVRDGSFEDLVAVFDPDVVLRVDRAEMALGAGAVARQALVFQRLAPYGRPALIDGAPGVVTIPPGGKAVAVTGFAVGGDRIVAMDVLADPDRLERIDVIVLGN